MPIKEKFWAFIEWAGRAETIYTVVKVYALPILAPVVTAALGYLTGESWMWIAMAAFLAFGGASIGVLSVSAYRQRKNPAHKLVFEGPNFSVDLSPAPMPVHGNRQLRRIQTKIKQEPQILSPRQISPSVSRKMEKGQIGVYVRNKASFPISCMLFAASTRVEEFTPPRSQFPKAPKLLGPGEQVLISDDAIDLEETQCGPLAGEMDLTIRYGLPGDEKHELRLRATLNIQMEHFGFVSTVQAGWLT